MITWRLLHLKGYPIFKQLQLEEALLRADEGNWCIINEGSSQAIVMGISGQPDLLLNKKLLENKPVPLIRRFSGGGTVFVDHHTHFITFIGNSDELLVPPCPQQVLGWTESLYQPLLKDLDFGVRENDYVIGDLKFGGNAQYMRKNRWLHHSSLLWNFNSDNMDYLKIPSRMPKYRNNRGHIDFLCRLSDHLTERSLINSTVKQGLSQKFHLIETSLNDVQEILDKPHRKSVEMIDLTKLQ